MRPPPARPSDSTRAVLTVHENAGFVGDLALSVPAATALINLPSRITKLFVLLAAEKRYDSLRGVSDELCGLCSAKYIAEMMGRMPESYPILAGTARSYVRQQRRLVEAELARVRADLGIDILVQEMISGRRGYRLGDVDVVGIDLDVIIALLHPEYDRLH